MIDPNSGMVAATMFGGVMDEADKLGLSLAQQAGNKVITLDAAETQRWQRAVTGVRAIWYKKVADMGQDGLKLATEAERLIAKYNKK